jgi:hypothetical protein
MKAHLLTIAIVAVGIQTDLRPTLQELARQLAPGPVYQSRINDFVTKPFEESVQASDLLIHGKVERINTYLSQDQKDLQSDYVVRVSRVLRPTPSQIRSRPGALNSLETVVITRWGGSLIIDGVQVTQADAAVPAFQVGQDVVLLLSAGLNGEKYRLTSPVTGTFTVRDSRLEPLSQDATARETLARFSGMTIEEFSAEVNRIASRR